MHIRFKKCSGRYDAMTCDRLDGSSIRCPMPKQGILPHDVVHFVVEDTLDLRQGFYGLIAAGINFPTGEPPWNADEFDLPDLTEALQAESLVECFQAELWSGSTEHKSFREILQITCAQRKVEAPLLTDNQIEDVRSRLQSFTETWNALPVGSSIDVQWQTTTLWVHESTPERSPSRDSQVSIGRAYAKG